MACININLPTFKRLETKFGFTVAEALCKQMDTIPTIDQAFKYIRNIKNDKSQDIINYLQHGKIYEKSILMSKLTGIIHTYKKNLYVTTGLPETTLLDNKSLATITPKEMSIKYPILFSNLLILDKIKKMYPELLNYELSSSNKSYIVTINSQYLSNIQESKNKLSSVNQPLNNDNIISSNENNLDFNEYDENNLDFNEYDENIVNSDEIVSYFTYSEAIDYFNTDEPFAFKLDNKKNIYSDEKTLNQDIIPSTKESNKLELKSVGLQLTLPFDQVIDGLDFLSENNKKILNDAIDEGDVPIICDL